MSRYLSYLEMGAENWLFLLLFLSKMIRIVHKLLFAEEVNPGPHSQCFLKSACLSSLTVTLGRLAGHISSREVFKILRLRNNNTFEVFGKLSGTL